MKKKQKQKQKQKSWDELLLPGEILELIFSKLPFFSFPNCRLVSKSWNDLISNRKFDNPKSLFFAQTFLDGLRLHCVDLDPQHLEGIHTLASFTFPSIWSSTLIKIIDSVNGLFLCSLRFDKHFQRIYILNPITNEFINLNPTFNSKEDRIRKYHYGFGFDLKTKQYKIVRCSPIRHRVYIYSFGTTSSSSRQWTDVGSMDFILEEEHPVYFNGAIYWVGSRNSSIFRFDLEHEKFDRIPFPNVLESYHQVGSSSLRFFGVLNDTPYLTFHRPLQGVEVWKMEHHSSSSSSSWIKTFFVRIPNDLVHRPILAMTQIYREHLRIFENWHLQLIKVCEDGKILCLYRGFDLILYDPTTGRSQLLTGQDVQVKKHLIFY